MQVHYESHNIYEDTPISGGRGSGESEEVPLGFTPSPLLSSSYLRKSPRSFKQRSSPPTSPLPKNLSHSKPLGRPTGLPSGLFTSAPSGMGNTSISRRVGFKRASLFTWLTLQSIPEETMISPSILDFLEKVLEPIPEPSKTALSSPVSAGILMLSP